MRATPEWTILDPLSPLMIAQSRGGSTVGMLKFTAE
jgi:hypothetical protein